MTIVERTQDLTQPSCSPPSGLQNVSVDVLDFYERIWLWPSIVWHLWRPGTWHIRSTWLVDKSQLEWIHVGLLDSSAELLTAVGLNESARRWLSKLISGRFQGHDLAVPTSSRPDIATSFLLKHIWWDGLRRKWGKRGCNKEKCDVPHV